MVSIKKYLPNSITLVNLSSGFTGIILFAMLRENRLQYIPLILLICLIADFLDGFLARKLNARSALGVQLDSLSDLVSFGVVPSLVVLSLLSEKMAQDANFLSHIVPAAFSIMLLVFTALRLGKFNLGGGKIDHFLGLPSPANAIFFTGLIFLKTPQFEYLLHPYIIASAIIVFSILMVSSIPMFDLKFKTFGWHGNKERYLYLLAVIIILLIFRQQGVSLCIIAYILASLINNSIKR